MCSRVSWQGELGGKFTICQRNCQGATGSPDDFKKYTFDHINTMAIIGHGTHIGSTYIGTIACADNVLLTVGSEQELKVQLDLMNTFTNPDRLKLHPQKTCVHACGIIQTEMEHLGSLHPWAINGEPTWELITTLHHSMPQPAPLMDARLTWQEHCLRPHGGRAPWHKWDQPHCLPTHIFSVCAPQGPLRSRGNLHQSHQPEKVGDCPQGPATEYPKPTKENSHSTSVHPKWKSSH